MNQGFAILQEGNVSISISMCVFFFLILSPTIEIRGTRMKFEN